MRNVRVGRTRARWGAGLILAVGALVLPGLTPAALATTPVPVPHPGQIKPVLEPLGLGNRKVTVIVEVKGEPLAVVQSHQPDAPLTEDQKQNIDLQLSRVQAPIATQVRKLGGQVVASYRAAYNGIKVVIPQGQLAKVQAIPGVVAIHALRSYTRSTAPATAASGALGAWSGLASLQGQGIKVAVIDTGIDYTHANFGGPGTVAAYEAAFETNTQPADPAWFGPNAPRVKGGIDLVGDSYNSDETSDTFQPIAHPDPNPLDCDGHGSHTSGILGGSGVLANGKTYTGPYTPAAVDSQKFTILPGVAPAVDLYAIRVFGCLGSTDVVIDAIDWAVAHGMNVINMSLGSSLGTADEPSAVASSNAAKAGIIVVAAAGNDGQAPYIDSSPATGNGVISVAASDPHAGFPGAIIKVAGGSPITAIDANGADLDPTITYKIKVIKDDPKTDVDESLGCSPDAFGVVDSHTMAVVIRGTCARVAKAIYGQEAGAGVVVMVNNQPGFPPFEGPITTNPDNNEPATVTIPFLGVEGPADDETSPGAALLKDDGKTATLSPTAVDNPTYRATADFSSSGPRGGDSWLKPDVTAPGVSITSTGVGTGDGPAIESGTSMSSPFVAGVAALVRQAHPTWKDPRLWRDAIVNTASSAQVADYLPSFNGSGLVQVGPATLTSVLADGPNGAPSLSYGFAELASNFSRSLPITVRNVGSSSVTLKVSKTEAAGPPHSVSVASSLTVPANSTRTLLVRLSIAADSAGDSSTFNEVSGLIVLTPSKGQNHNVALRVPYYLVPQTASIIRTTLDLPDPALFGTATITNTGPGAGLADFFAWGLVGGTNAVLGSDDLRSAGAASFPDAGVLVFAIGTQNRWSNPSENEFDVYVDANNDGVDDYLVAAVDLGGLTDGIFTGETAVAVTTIATGNTTVEFMADAPFNSTTMELPVLFEQLCDAGQPCASPAHPRISYHVASSSLLDATSDTLPGVAVFNIYAPAISIDQLDSLGPGETATASISINRGEWRLSPALGLMVRVADNPNGAEAQLIPINP